MTAKILKFRPKKKEREVIFSEDTFTEKPLITIKVETECPSCSSGLVMVLEMTATIRTQKIHFLCTECTYDWGVN